MNENEIQRAVFAHIRTRGAPGVFAFHPKNGGIHQRGRRRTGINSGLGVVSGVPDVIIVKDAKTYALELKREAGLPSPEQQKCWDVMRQAGAMVSVAFGLDDALAQLEGWGILRGSAA